MIIPKETLISVKVTINMKEKLAYLSRLHDGTISTEVRKAIEKHLNANKNNLKPKTEENNV